MKTITELKSYFEHGDIPTEGQFRELLDTMFELFANAQATANAAVETANAASGVSPKALLKFDVGAGTIIADTNVATVTLFSSSANQKTWDIDFTAPLANSNYIVLLGGPPVEVGTSGTLGNVARVVAQSTTSVRVSGGTSGTLFVMCI